MFEKYYSVNTITNLKKNYPFLARYKDETIRILNMENIQLNDLKNFNPKICQFN